MGWEVTSNAPSARDRFKEAIAGRYKSAVKTADVLRKLVLFDSGDTKKTELVSFPVGKCDPLVQLILMARDQYLGEEDGQVKLGFFKTMRDLMITCEGNTVSTLEMIMKERHHKDKMAALDAKMGNAEPSDAEVERAAAGIEREPREA